MSHHNNMTAIDIDSRRQAYGIQLEELESLIRKFSRNLFLTTFPTLRCPERRKSHSNSLPHTAGDWKYINQTNLNNMNQQI